MDYLSKTRNPDEVKFNELPDETFAIQFYDRLYVEYDIDGGIIPVQSGQIFVSPLIWMKGKLLTRQKLVDEYPDVAANIIPQMEHANVSHVVYVMGTFKPFDKHKDIFWNKLGKKIYDRQPIYNAGTH